ncbi:phage baseplate assembly protein V [Chromobacterium subtsugae]|uniref:Phage baseplate assembly protein V n=1 Tax=Chromobacterium subtsugae TaxID=251747 RepID=A0ABS7FHI2_9NEIS|nr:MULTISPECIES: phage baseplate assembly protein V [Chromobacterium]KUM02273.1 phage baseplate protein [Chromobacterium subtsugae]KZE86228.1 phage baseplate protein [Chromobacterium sp. F49]MBW7568075.1 phage baseplate assembly protein [Chromobacterium subtsugae]MBW8289551.1 phage baseplate assembly protein V [Chromobacterium subtsugae]OBU86244.1 phage baseplate protein [Chromobacterium subtsugae]
MWHEVDHRIRRAFSNVRQGFRAALTHVDSAGAVQTAQAEGLAGEQLQDAELFQHYGYTSNPPPGSMAMVLPLGGRTSHSVVLATEHGSYRLQSLQPGEVALYSDEGSKIVLKRGKIIEATCDHFVLNCQTMQVKASDSIALQCQTMQVNADQQAAFATPTLQTSQQLVAQGQISGNGGLAVQGGGGASFSGDIKLSGAMNASGDVNAGGKSLVSHIHDAPNGPTSPPK